MKRFFRLAFETFTWLLFFGGVANAGPLAAAVAGFASFLGSGTLLANIVNLAIGVAIKLGISLIERAKGKNNDARQPGIKGNIQVGGTNPISFLVGYCATAGQLEYINTWGNVDKTENAYLTMVISLSDIPITSLLSRVWINGELCTIDFDHPDASGMGFPVLEFQKSGKNYAWIKFHDGTQTVADPYVVSKFSGDPDRAWTSAMVGNGIAYVVATFLLERSLFTGIPTMRFECQGIKLYNLAKDSTNGGSGANRYDDPTTWDYEDDNASVIYNITRGIYFNGQWYYGGQSLPQTLLPSATWIASYNECKTAISLAGGGTEPQFRCGYEITVDQEPLSTIEKFLDGCGGDMAELGGFYKLHVGAPGPSVYSFTDADIVATEELNLDPFPGLQQTYNGANAKYPEPGEAWELKDAPPYLVAAYEAADEGRRLIASLSFDTTPYNTQVQRLIKPAVEANRRFRRHVVALPPEAWLLEPAIDTVDWTSTREGYTNKEFKIVGMTGKRGLIQFLQILEIEPSDYNWTPGTDQKPYSIGYVGSVRPGPQPMYGWTAVPYIMLDTAARSRRATIQVGYSGDQPDVASVHILARLKASGNIVFDGTINYGAPDAALKTNVLDPGAFLPNETYEVSGKFIPFSGRDTEQSEWITVTTDNILLGALDIYPIDLGQLASDVRNLQEWTGNAVRDLIEEIRASAANAASGHLANYFDVQTIRREASITSNNNKAQWTEDITVATGPDSVLGQQITQINLVIDNLGSTYATLEITNALSGRVDTTDGNVAINADAITALNASYDGTVGSATFRMGVNYTPADGWTSRIGLETRISSTDEFKAAGLFLESDETRSRVIIIADQFIATDGTTDAKPFVVIDGIAYADQFRVDFAKITNVEIDFATINNVHITGDMVVDGSIDSPSLALKAVTDNASNFTDYFIYDASMAASYIDVATITVNNAVDNPVSISLWYAISSFVNNVSSVRIVRNGVELTDWTRVYSGSGGGIVFGPTMAFDAGAPAGVLTYSLQLKIGVYSGGAGTTRMAGRITGMIFKR